MTPPFGLRRRSRLARALLLLTTSPLVACDRTPRDRPNTTTAAARASSDDTLRAAVVTQAVRHDADDPAIWLDPADASRSLILGTDKGDSTGGVYVFSLDGTIDTTRTRRPLQRPNNVDVIEGMVLGGDTVSIAVAAERGTMSLRVFRLPDMTPVDGGGIPVFDGDRSRAPMGVALYRRPSDGAIFAFVGGKSGPANGYLWQYRLRDNGRGTIEAERVRAVGRYSGRKEIEAIAVDRQLGFLYYSDESVGIRQYHANPDVAGADDELALFGTSGFVGDHEGIALYPTGDRTGYLVVSDQQGQRLRVFAREGTADAPYAHPLLAVIPVDARETDGLDVTAASLGARFPNGALVMMSTDRTFHIYDWRDVARHIARRDTAGHRQRP